MRATPSFPCPQSKYIFWNINIQRKLRELQDRAGESGFFCGLLVAHQAVLTKARCNCRGWRTRQSIGSDSPAVGSQRNRESGIPCFQNLFDLCGGGEGDVSRYYQHRLATFRAQGSGCHSQCRIHARFCVVKYPNVPGLRQVHDMGVATDDSDSVQAIHSLQRGDDIQEHLKGQLTSFDGAEYPRETLLCHHQIFHGNNSTRAGVS